MFAFSIGRHNVEGAEVACHGLLILVGVRLQRWCSSAQERIIIIIILVVGLLTRYVGLLPAQAAVLLITAHTTKTLMRVSVRVVTPDDHVDISEHDNGNENDLSSIMLFGPQQ